MKVLITGANGFLGASLARELADKGHEVKAMVRRLGENAELQHPQILEVKGDVRDLASLKAAMSGIEQVYHLAALSTDWAADLRDFYTINVLGTVNVLQAAKEAGVAKVLNTSSAGPIGPPDPDDIHPVNEDHIRTVDYFIAYESSKAMADERALRFVLEGMHIVTVNPTRVYGPGPLERKNGYLMLIHQYLTKKVAVYPGFKTQLANFVHLEDVVKGMVLAMEKGRSGQSYLLGGSNVSFLDLFQTLQKVSGKRTKTIAIPHWFLGFLAGIAAFVSRITGKAPILTRTWLRKASYSWPVSSDKAIRELGYAPMDYETGIRKTVDWLTAEREAGRIK
jgi:nucleoside-diphosphate-sugar epimerase